MPFHTCDIYGDFNCNFVGEFDGEKKCGEFVFYTHSYFLHSTIEIFPSSFFHFLFFFSQFYLRLFYFLPLLFWLEAATNFLWGPLVLTSIAVKFKHVQNICDIIATWICTIAVKLRDVPTLEFFSPSRSPKKSHLKSRKISRLWTGLWGSKSDKGSWINDTSLTFETIFGEYLAVFLGTSLVYKQWKHFGQRIKLEK